MREALPAPLWRRCLDELRGELSPEVFHTWILPLHAVEEGDTLRLLAPNRFVLDRVRNDHSDRIGRCLARLAPVAPQIMFEIGSQDAPTPASTVHAAVQGASNLQRDYLFESFVEGKSNQLAVAAARQIAENPGGAYNPLLVYGGVGLGKTHLLHAIGNQILSRRPDAKVVYLGSERFVSDMVKALQHNALPEFKRHYRSLNCLLIDDVQFFGGKDVSQEEFFHTFNALLERQQQVVLTCDRYPKEMRDIEERLKSRFAAGLTVAIEPADLETRVAILTRKAALRGIELPSEVAFFIGRRVRSNIRELEGALTRVMADASFLRQELTVDLAKNALKDLLSVQEKLVTIENIQRTVAEYFKLRVADLLSNKRNRSLARPRQMAMAIAKELTNHSLPEIGTAFGGRDHTTVLHACRKIESLKKGDLRITEDHANLLRILTS